MNRRRILSALTGAALLGGVLAASVATPHTVAAAQCSAPYVSSVSNALAHRDDSVTVTGSGFTCGGQGNGTSLTVGGSGQSITGLADTSITFRASGAAGSVVVTVSYPVLLGSQTQSSNTERLLLMAPVADQGTATPGPGGGFTVSGSGFTMGGFTRGITASACGQGLPVGTVSDGSVPLNAPGGYCNGGVSLGITGYATSTRNASILTNTVGLAAGAIDVAPSPGGLSTTAAAPGQVVSFSGAGYGNSGSATLNGAPIGSSWSDNTISFTVRPDSTSGPVVFTRADGRQIPAGNLTVNSQIAGPTSARAQAGDTVTINGAGFGPNAGTVTLGGTALGIKGWSPTSIAVTIPAAATGGDLTVTPQGTAPSTLPNGLVILHLGALRPANGAAGSTIGITGRGFGSQKGSVTIAGVNAPVQLWGDGTIAVVVPSIPRFAGGGGDDHITVNVPGAASPLTAAFHIDPGAASTPGNTPGSTPGDPTGTAAPNTSTPGFIPPSGDGPLVQIGPVPFHKTPKVAGPVDLAIKSDRSSGNPGVNIPFTVSLTAFGNPVVGAPVDLLLVVVPGGDASISPAKGVTDASGRVSGVLHLSKRAGDHIILARSGQYSDEIKVTGLGLVSTGGADSGLGNVGGGSPQRTIIVAALLACLVLFLSGFGINLATAHNSSTASAAAAPRRGVAGSLVAVPVNAGAAAQFGLAMIVCTVGQLVALLRRR
jgi:IPT/TIG domain